MQQPEKYSVLIARLSNKTIAYSIWDIDMCIKSNIGDHGIEKRRDADPAHMKEYSKRMSETYSKYFNKYGSKQLRLEWLIVHPDFRYRGAGTILCNWGKEEAIKRGGWTLTVTASPMGKCLYNKLGYQDLGVVVAQVDKEVERVGIFVLAKEDLVKM
ncbi:hypothetical protein M406DRAFT_357110 [Cryphonectria parasitica EP155]|uniref:N-acetyltransferase domain-containing protein n=1 Tax=Cryphonectria parasitica (strain ATCC 38755 / EP155) TaxID=660469 RepID=A0A9P5CMX5_CRYP1|nr:uncharacterized protein M406DRAFT_357110 [Cryphonectria parasitica EP155]KAF3763536.1 hypothetical protein M406DRAFT_357110 [Cryphonectria parasitica EP155]